MKFLYSSITLLSALALFQPLAHAASEDTAVFYEGTDAVEITDHTLCIPLTKNGHKVVEVTFGLDVECDFYNTSDCQGDPFHIAYLVRRTFNPVETGNDANGAIKCGPLE